MTSSLYSEYENYFIKYSKIYGNNTCVLYQSGSFFEIYAIDDGLIDIKSMAELLNIQISKRNKSIEKVDRSNTLMAGFPLYTLHKFVKILVDNNYTVIVVEQVTDPPKPKRAVTNIYSPGTIINDLQCYETNNLICINIQNINNNIIIGLSMIDVSTGNSKIIELSSQKDRYNSLDEIYRIIHIYQPKEIIIIGDIIDNINIIDYLDIHKVCVHNNVEISSDISNIHYQNKLLNKIFPDHGLLSVIEYLDLEKSPIALVSFVYLLQFCFQHNDSILLKIKKPEFIDQIDKLILSYNCMKQLQIISSDKNNLLELLNTCVSSIGKRLFKELFLNPITNIDILEKRYSYIESMILNNKYKNIREHLKNIYDVERLFRKIALQIIDPCNFVQICESIQSLLNIFDENSNVDSLYFIKNELKSILEYINNKLNLVEASKYNIQTITNSFFKINSFLISEKQNKYNNLCNFYNKLIESLPKDIFKIENNNSEGNYIIITQKRYNDFKKQLEPFTFTYENYSFDFKNATFKTIANSYKITHNSFTILNNNIQKIKDELVELVKEEYKNFIHVFYDTFKDSMNKMIIAIGEIDFYTANAKNACVYKYYKPTIKNNDTSYIIGKNLRHPIIERINTQIEYISNDVALGLDINGIILYGTNMVGKSAYMKSIGISILMAQSGMFVPCQDFEYYPFQYVFSRIPSGDDIFKGKSTFAVEINELRNILKRANENSLVIGDELASGTESISAISIVASGIFQLYQKKSKFIFATHLHDLTKLKEIKKLEKEKLKIYHLSVIYDDVQKKLIYNRKLQEGQGNTIYGLEVCRALDLPNDFLLNANKFRQELLDIHSTILHTKKSHFNSSHYVDICSICGKNAEEVHHIKHQKDANEDGFIDNIHKNNLSNLVNLCEECHDKTHNGTININGYIQTSNGIELDCIIKKENNEYYDKICKLKNELKYSYNRIHKEIPELSLYKIKKIYLNLK